LRIVTRHEIGGLFSEIGSAALSLRSAPDEPETGFPFGPMLQAKTGPVMTPEQVFNISTVLAVMGWIVLVFLPSHRAAVEGIARTLVPALLSAAYVVILVPALLGGGGTGTLGSFEGVAAILNQPWLLVAGWLHYLAFDLLVGAWQVTTARSEGIPHYAVLPCLLLTFILGPVGFLAFLIVRWSLGHRW
jgi:hypothetical protein